MNKALGQEEWAMKTNSTKIVVFHVVMALVVLAFCLMGEIVVRITGFDAPRQTVTFYESLVKYRPHTRFMNRKERRNVVEFNNLGFHDRNRQVENEKYRIVFLGDSYVEGNQVSVDSLFTCQLEDRFQEKRRAIEIVNGGVGGVGTAYEYLLWREYLRKNMRFNHLVLCICLGNDLGNNHPVLEQRVLGNSPYDKAFLDSRGNVYLGGCSEAERRTLWEAATDSLSNHSALINMIHTRLVLLRKALLRRRSHGIPQDIRDGSTVRDNRRLIDSSWRDSIVGTLHLIERWKGELTAENVRFSIVVLKPDWFYAKDRAAYYEMFMRGLRGVALKNDIALLELSFKGHDPYQVFSFDGTRLGHFNDAGHELAAEMILGWLESCGLQEGSKDKQLMTVSK